MTLSPAVNSVVGVHCCHKAVIVQWEHSSWSLQVYAAPFPPFFSCCDYFKIYLRIIHKKHFLKKIYYDLYFCQKDQD